MKSKVLKAYAYFILIISILFFLRYSLKIYIAGFIRECDRIKITDKNRKEIVSLMEEAIAFMKNREASLANDDFYLKMPGINLAREIECYVKLHHKDITVYYEDETTYTFHMRGYHGPLISLIQNEGYNVYFRSSEFITDLVKPVISLIFVVFAVAAIKNT